MESCKDLLAEEAEEFLNASMEKMYRKKKN